MDERKGEGKDEKQSNEEAKFVSLVSLSFSVLLLNSFKNRFFESHLSLDSLTYGLLVLTSFPAL